MHLVLIFWVVVGLFLVIVGAFSVLFVMAARLEKLHLNDFIPKASGEPLADSPYFNAMNDAAKRLGFTAAGVFIQNLSSRTYRAHVALWVSPDQDILLQIAGGKTGGVPVQRTILVSVFSSNQIIQTQDRAAAADLSGFTDQQILIDADLDELCSCHRERLASYVEQKRPFSSETAFSDWESIRRMRVEEIARMGLAKFLNQERTIYRYTLKGAWLQYCKGLLGPLAEAKNQVDRMPKMRPGSS
jgi:hypothetical protein